MLATLLSLSVLDIQILRLWLPGFSEQAAKLILLILCHNWIFVSRE
jgi:hypothetical protein